MAGRHQVTVTADLTVLRIAAGGYQAGGIFGRRRRRSNIGILPHGTRSRAGCRAVGSYAHATHPSPQLKLLQFLLEELQVSLALAHLGVKLGANIVIVRLLSHQISGLDQSLLALDLLVNVHHLVFVGHVGGIVPARSGRAESCLGVFGWCDLLRDCVEEGLIVSREATR